MKWLFPLLLLCVNAAAQLTLSLPTDAPPNYFVATNGAWNNSGRLDSPLDFSSAARSNHVSKVFWFVNGLYSNSTTLLIANNCVYRAYPGHAPIIGHPLVIGPTMMSNTLRGLNLVSYESERSVTDFVSSGGLSVSGPWTRTIGNNVVGHSWGGLGTWIEATNSFHYGDAFVGNGLERTDLVTKNGHSLYAQNASGTKTIIQCYFGAAVSTTVDIRGTSSAQVNNVYFQSNFVTGASSVGLLPEQYPYEFITQRGDSGNTGVSNVWITDNFIIHDGTDGASSFLGIGQEGVAICGTNSALHFDRNYCRAGFANLGDYNGFTFWTNTIWTDSASFAGRISVIGYLNYPAGSIKGNQWFFATANHPWQIITNSATDVGAINDLTTWQGFVGDANATLTAAAPTAVVTRWQTNGLRDAYDSWIGDALVWNPNRVSNNVAVALAGVPAGTRIDVRHCGDLLGPSVFLGAYNGTSITLPMTNLSTYTPNDLDWPRLAQPTNGAMFRVFIAADPIPLNLKPFGIGWQFAGVDGGIPTSQAIYTNLNSLTGVDNSTNIEAAVRRAEVAYVASGTWQVVLLTNVMYGISSTIDLTNVGVILRISSITTISNETGLQICIRMQHDCGNLGEWQSPVAAQCQIWTNANSWYQGNNTFTVSNVSGLRVGQIAFIDQLNDEDTSGVGNSGTFFGGWSSLGDPNRGNDRLMHQIVTVTNITGNTVMIKHGLMSDKWRQSLKGQIWWQSAQVPLTYAGVEGGTIVAGGGSTYGVYLLNTENCWVKGVTIKNARYHIATAFSKNNNIVNNTVLEATSGDSYPLWNYNSDLCFYYNNIGNGCETLWLATGGNGNFVGYNYSTNLLSGFVGGGRPMHGSYVLHGAHPIFNIGEGNVGTKGDLEGTWGSSDGNVLYRNRLTGVDEYMLPIVPGQDTFVQAVTISRLNLRASVIGNVLGTEGVNEYYEASDPVTTAAHEWERVYFLANTNSFWSASAWTFFQNVIDGMFRGMNWDSATATNSGLVTGGLATNDLRDSYYFTNKPPEFGFLTWPPVMPWNPTYSSSRTNIPAGYRFIYGTDPTNSVATSAAGNLNVGQIRINRFGGAQ